jgi:nucleoid-associated protein Lsr2
MAKRVIEQLVSDLSGKDIKDGEGESIKFSIGSTSYEMDLTEAEAGQFYDAVKKYTDVATKTGGRGSRSGGGSTSKSDRGQTQAIRAWARENGLEVSDRGRISQDVQAAYSAAH